MVCGGLFVGIFVVRMSVCQRLDFDRGPKKLWSITINNTIIHIYAICKIVEGRYITGEGVQPQMYADDQNKIIYQLL